MDPGLCRDGGEKFEGDRPDLAAPTSSPCPGQESFQAESVLFVHRSRRLSPIGVEVPFSGYGDLADQRRISADAPARPRPRAAGNPFICVHLAIGDPGFDAAQGDSAVLQRNRFDLWINQASPAAGNIAARLDRLSVKLPELAGRDKPGYDGKELYSLRNKHLPR